LNNYENQYLSIMKDILDNGIDRPDRTGLGSRSTWGQTLRINLNEGFPIITTRKVNLKVAFEETWFFLRGETDTKKLEDKKVKIWNPNTTREWLDSHGLSYLPEGHMGKGYGFQWRHFNGDYDSIDQTLDVTKSANGIDQIKMLLEGLKNDPNSRRHLVTAWNPSQINEMALPPCHIMHSYQVLNGKLNSSFKMRSSDFLYGLPFNVMGYALLNQVFAKYLQLEPNLLIYQGDDVHLYSNQIDIASQQIQRIPHSLPRLNIHKQFNSLDDILKLEYSDIELVNYIFEPDFKNKPAMAL
jgi:thymidylate synthase